MSKTACSACELVCAYKECKNLCPRFVRHSVMLGSSSAPNEANDYYGMPLEDLMELDEQALRDYYDIITKKYANTMMLFDSSPRQSGAGEMLKMANDLADELAMIEYTLDLYKSAADRRKT